MPHTSYIQNVVDQVIKKYCERVGDSLVCTKPQSNIIDVLRLSEKFLFYLNSHPIQCSDGVEQWRITQHDLDMTLSGIEKQANNTSVIGEVGLDFRPQLSQMQNKWASKDMCCKGLSGV